MMLEERKIKILAAIIDEYISTAEPVSSRTIARKYNLGISPATIRNEMADLEESGYLFQPHTSAGRIPSHKGYRYYVDFLLPSKKLNEIDQTLIRRAFEKRVNELEEIAKQAARVISRLTSYTAIIMGPQLETSHLKHIQITRIDETKGLLLMVTNYGNVSHHIIDIPQNFSDSDFVRISNILNANLTGKTFSEITNEIMDAVKTEMIEYDEILNLLLEILLDNLGDIQENTQVVSAGSSKMLEYPEFQDVEKVKSFLSLLEHRELIIKALKDLSKPNTITVTIGNENTLTELQDFSIVTANVSVDKKNLGIFGIMGPTRMEYSRVISILEQVTEYLIKTVSDML
ncbi:Heat-inducible transcription repressor HrcA [Tepidanaerobacter acetatoxydans Re1]|uniref:Heat-inducible transcription repressor HrcA n=1 Tax=Tepidanaerobacter acetatoxydans (strain DSM 21804 / JCM 16047 / Re1) TaxID=1209989 RepID=F4LSH4_TEPAE|nr:heat-inducible transcriptional repressor HrcA [Tepidanaerobacter acetatoxydans]AEE91240.1 heat-inducible transcription repressor HrcA [Tepidanaerobacter acetatoxydans Re1]CCP25918.2 Heat-inducible transcription repressor HrcA [Tepidanaerobacter acetatoxydans Re1]